MQPFVYVFSFGGVIKLTDPSRCYRSFVLKVIPSSIHDKISGDDMRLLTRK